MSTPFLQFHTLLLKFWQNSFLLLSNIIRMFFIHFITLHSYLLILIYKHIYLYYSSLLLYYTLSEHFCLYLLFIHSFLYSLILWYLHIHELICVWQTFVYFYLLLFNIIILSIPYDFSLLFLYFEYFVTFCNYPGRLSRKIPVRNHTLLSPRWLLFSSVDTLCLEGIENS